MKNVSMFIPCLVDLFLPEIGESTFILLSKLGVKPAYHTAQTCCGQPFINAGHQKKAIAAAKHFIKVFENDDAIVCPSGSCVYTIKHHYPKLLDAKPEWKKRAERIGAKTFELSQYIVDVLGIEDVGASSTCKAVFHESCRNLRSLGISDQPKKLINAIKNIQILPLKEADVCCGFGGEFSINFPSISEAIVKQKVQHFLDSDANVLLLSEPGCLLNITGYLERHHPGKKAMHIASLLAPIDKGDTI